MMSCPRQPQLSLSLVLSLVLVLNLLAAAAAADWPPPVPSQLDLTVRETAGIARAGEMVSSGVPLPRSLAITDPAVLTLVDGGGTPIPSDFRVLARWHADPSRSAVPIQWLLVSFAATVPANGTATYRLLWDGSAGGNPPAPSPLQLSQNGNQVTVDTGAARFVVGTASEPLFSSIQVGGSTLVSGGTMSGVVDATSISHPTTRSVTVKRSGPLVAVVTVDGAYDLPAVGGGLLGSSRRYVFHAGSATAIVRHVANWEGDRCGLDVLDCGGGTMNGLRIARLRDTLALGLGDNLTLHLLGARSDAMAAASAGPADSAAIRQLRRNQRLDPLSFSASAPGVSGSGAKADGAFLVASGASGSVGIALDRMHRYEPQALRLLAGGELAIDWVDDDAWLANHQGIFASLAVAALGPSPNRAEIERTLWAPLTHPLRAWPSAHWFAASQAVPELPFGPLGPELASYDTTIPAILQTTVSELEARGLGGIMTFGLYPRYWGNPILSDEIDCGLYTPADAWDDKFWCGAWTDYHNALATVPLWAMRSGQVEWLDELAEPGALRQLHSQVVQCAPGDSWDRCGWASTGYGAYRSDNNGSHGYFENLALYYWLTGDETVPAILRRGAEFHRGFVCPSRGTDGSGPTCAPNDPIPDPWAGVNGRTASQAYTTLRLLGLAEDDSFLDDWTSNTARWLTQYYGQPLLGGRAIGFMIGSGGGSFDFLNGPGSYWTDQLWMASLYDFDLLYRLAVDTQDAPLGSPALSPSSAVGAWGRLLEEVSRLSSWSDGSLAAPWPNEVEATFSGARIGGELTMIREEIDGDADLTPCEFCGDDDGGACFDLCLYDTGKSILAGVLARAADLTSEAAIADLARNATAFALAVAADDIQPLNKFTGEYLSRLHPAVARLGLDSGLFGDGFESGDSSSWSLTAP